jgi:hypothetical protein
VASAEVVVAGPPRYVVEAKLWRTEGPPVAEALGIFRPSDSNLPSDPSPEKDEGGSPMPPPASFMPVHTTPYGMLCLN